jgi:ABC-type sugar transport system ATPase subunit
MQAADFDVHEGEILGVTGLTGSGYEDIPYALGAASRGNRGTGAHRRARMGPCGPRPA